MAKETKHDFLSVIGDTENKEYPIYMKGKYKDDLYSLILSKLNLKIFLISSGPKLYTMCSVLIDLDEQTLSIFQGNPKNKEISHVFSLSELKKP